jgi:hypothetical protein
MPLVFSGSVVVDPKDTPASGCKTSAQMPQVVGLQQPCALLHSGMKTSSMVLRQLNIFSD